MYIIFYDTAHIYYHKHYNKIKKKNNVLLPDVLIRKKTATLRIQSEQNQFREYSRSEAELNCWVSEPQTSFIVGKM